MGDASPPKLSNNQSGDLLESAINTTEEPQTWAMDGDPDGEYGFCYSIKSQGLGLGCVCVYLYMYYVHSYLLTQT